MPPGSVTAHFVPTAIAEALLPAQTVIDLWQTAGGPAAAVYLADAAGRLVFSNAAFDRLPSAVRATISLPMEDVAAAVEALGRPLRQDTLVDVDGRREYYTVERMILRDKAERPVAVVGRFLPAGELHLAETEWRLAEERFSDTARMAPDWIWESDHELVVRFVGGRACERLGYAPHEIVGRSLRDLLGTGSVSHRLLCDRARQPLTDVTTELRHKDGSSRLFALTAVPVFDQRTGGFRGYRGLARELGDREGESASLLKAVADAQAANRAKTDFLANMSHELRTPLNAIMGFSEVMKLELAGPLGHDKYREYTDDILTSSQHLLRVINDILDVAKIEAGQVELDEGEVLVSDLLKLVTRIASERAARAKLTLRIARMDPSLRIRGDDRRLEQVLLNLVTNSLKFTHAGGEVVLSANCLSDGSVEIAVADTGVGIAPDKIDVALAPFQQLDSGVSHRSEGTGLGLPLSKALIEMHGGSLQLESKVDVGTTVRVRLPAGRVLAR